MTAVVNRELVLLALRDAYQRDRATNVPAYNLGPHRCSWCGKHRSPMPGTKLDGHALCIVTDAFKLTVIGAIREHSYSMRVVADAIGVTHGTVMAWWRWWERQP